MYHLFILRVCFRVFVAIKKHPNKGSNLLIPPLRHHKLNLYGTEVEVDFFFLAGKKMVKGRGSVHVFLPNNLGFKLVLLYSLRL